MIHYHGTPITPREQLLRMAGRHFCVSFAEPRDLEPCLQIGQSVMLDNGAFSHYTRGLQPDWTAYYKWLEPMLGHPHFAVIPDIIDGTEEEQDVFLDEWPFLWSMGAPVWHLAESIDRLMSMIGQNWPRICFGSSGAYWQVGSTAWRHRMDEAFNAIVHHYNDVPWIHGLRMLGQADGHWPLASADSTNVAQNFKRDIGCADCKAARLDIVNPPIGWKDRGQDRLFDEAGS